MKIDIIKIKQEKIEFLNNLAYEAEKEGFTFVRNTINEWNSKENNFSKDGECLLGAYYKNKCIGIGGII